MWTSARVWCACVCSVFVRGFRRKSVSSLVYRVLQHGWIVIMVVCSGPFS
jgi:hypothetical protein